MPGAVRFAAGAGDHSGGADGLSIRAIDCPRPKNTLLRSVQPTTVPPNEINTNCRGIVPSMAGYSGVKNSETPSQRNTAASPVARDVRSAPEVMRVCPM